VRHSGVDYDINVNVNVGNHNDDQGDPEKSLVGEVVDLVLSSNTSSTTVAIKIKTKRY
jgi:hypothetical protein